MKIADKQNILNKILTLDEIIVPKAEINALKYGQLNALIPKAIAKSKYTLGVIDERTAQLIKEVIDNSTSAGQPIRMNITLGCYKNPHIASYPYPNWAEVFNLDLMSEVMNKIAHIYSNGAILDFFLQDLYLDKLIGVSKKDSKIYCEYFKKIVDHYNNLLPDNAKIIVDLYSNHYSDGEFERELEEFAQSVDESMIDNAVLRSRRNNVIAKTENELRKSARMHIAYVNHTFDRFVTPYVKDKLFFMHRKFYKEGIPLICYKSSRNSCVQFWVGEGCLTLENGVYVPRILSQNQLKSYKKIDFIENDMFDLESENLKKLYIYELV